MNDQKGFTLLELLVSIFIVSIVLTGASAIFVQALTVQRRAFNIQQAEDDAAHVLEAMAKEIRVATITLPLSDTANCAGAPDPLLAVNHPVNGAVSYMVTGGNVHRVVGLTDSVMNSNAVQFTRLGFCVKGVAIGDHVQPRITILANVKSVATNQQSTVDIQTTISQRLPSD